MASKARIAPILSLLSINRRQQRSNSADANPSKKDMVKDCAKIPEGSVSVKSDFAIVANDLLKAEMTTKME